MFNLFVCKQLLESICGDILKSLREDGIKSFSFKYLTCVFVIILLSIRTCNLISRMVFRKAEYIYVNVHPSQPLDLSRFCTTYDTDMPDDNCIPKAEVSSWCENSLQSLPLTFFVYIFFINWLITIKCVIKTWKHFYHYYHVIIYVKILSIIIITSIFYTNILFI